MSARVGTRRGAGRAAERPNGAARRSRIPVHLTLDEQVWTLAKQRFANVSRLVERLLEVALGLEPSVEVVRFGDLGGRGVAWPILPASGAGDPSSNLGGPTTRNFC